MDHLANARGSGSHGLANFRAAIGRTSALVSRPRLASRLDVFVNNDDRSSHGARSTIWRVATRLAFQLDISGDGHLARDFNITSMDEASFITNVLRSSDFR